MTTPDRGAQGIPNRAKVARANCRNAMGIGNVAASDKTRFSRSPASSVFKTFV